MEVKNKKLRRKEKQKGAKKNILPTSLTEPSMLWKNILLLQFFVEGRTFLLSIFGVSDNASWGYTLQ